MLSRSSSIRSAFFALLLGLAIVPVGVIARPHSTPMPSPTPTPPPEDMAVTVIARREFVAWQAGVVNLDHYQPAARPAITDAKVNQTSQGLGRAGSFERSEWVGPLVIDGAPAGARGYIYRMHCAQKDVYERLVMGADGKVVNIVFSDSLKDEPPTPAPTPTPFATP